MVDEPAEALSAGGGRHPPGDLTDRTFLITGASTGIGRATTHALAARGATVYMAGRSEPRNAAARDAIAAATGSERLHLLTVDLGELDSVRACAQAFLATGEPLHCLINNAGLAGQRGMSPSGFEVHFGTNHVGPFLLTLLLCDRLRDSAPSRIVNVASDAHYRAPGIDWEAVRRPTRTLTGFAEYGVSKLANVLHARELARRLSDRGISSCSLHPGVVASEIWRRVPWPIRPLIKLRMLTPEQGAQTSVFCATAAEIAQHSGLFYERCRPREPSAVVTDRLAAELWERTEAWVA